MTKIFEDDGVDFSLCRSFENDLSALQKELDCPKWGPWIPDECDAVCGHGKKKLNRECFVGDSLVQTSQCQAEYWNDQVS